MRLIFMTNSRLAMANFIITGCGTGNLARALIAEGMPPKLMTLLGPVRGHACTLLFEPSDVAARRPRQ